MSNRAETLVLCAGIPVLAVMAYLYLPLVLLLLAIVLAGLAVQRLLLLWQLSARAVCDRPMAEKTQPRMDANGREDELETIRRDYWNRLERRRVKPLRADDHTENVPIPLPPWLIRHNDNGEGV